MKLTLTNILIPSLLIIGTFAVIIFNGESSYECTGELSSGESTTQKTIYIVLTEYPLWTGIWSDSDGNVKLEIPNETVDYYSHTVKVGTMIQIHNPIYDSPGEIKGNFSTLSKALMLKIGDRFFTGKCIAIK